MQPVQSTRSTPNKKTKFLDTKIFIASLAVAVTIGLWNLLSNNAVQASEVAPTPVMALPPQPPAGEAQGFPPLPTLVPLVDAPARPATGSGQTPQVLANAQPGSLRSVTAPDQTIVQKSKPVFDQGMVTISGGRSAGSSSAPAPVTSTGSSKK